jgi:hypothetical protein
VEGGLLPFFFPGWGVFRITQFFIGGGGGGIQVRTGRRNTPQKKTQCRPQRPALGGPAHEISPGPLLALPPPASTPVPTNKRRWGDVGRRATGGPSAPAALVRNGHRAGALHRGAAPARQSRQEGEYGKREGRGFPNLKGDPVLPRWGGGEAVPEAVALVRC